MIQHSNSGCESRTKVAVIIKDLKVCICTMIFHSYKATITMYFDGLVMIQLLLCVFILMMVGWVGELYSDYHLVSAIDFFTVLKKQLFFSGQIAVHFKVFYHLLRRGV